MTEAEVFALLPTDAELSCTFGYPGNDRFDASYRTPDGAVWWIRKRSGLALPEDVPGLGDYWTIRQG